MRRLFAALSLLAVLTVQGPLAPCPAGAAPSHGHSAEAPSPHRHHAAAEPAHAGHVADSSVPPANETACTMLVSCQWVAVPTEAAAWTPVRPLPSPGIATVRQLPLTADLGASTPPPRTVS